MDFGGVERALEKADEAHDAVASRFLRRQRDRQPGAVVRGFEDFTRRGDVTADDDVGEGQIGMRKTEVGIEPHRLFERFAGCEVGILAVAAQQHLATQQVLEGAQIGGRLGSTAGEHRFLDIGDQPCDQPAGDHPVDVGEFACAAFDAVGRDLTAGRGMDETDGNVEAGCRLTEGAFHQMVGTEAAAEFRRRRAKSGIA